MVSLAVVMVVLGRALVQSRRRDPTRRHLNAYERACAATLCLFASQVATAADVDGSSALLPAWLRFGAQVSMRFWFEVALFEVGVAHCRSLDFFARGIDRFATGLNRVWGVPRLALIAAVASSTLKSWEILGVPAHSRRACRLMRANLAWHLCMGSLELSFAVFLITAAVRAIRRLRSQLRSSWSAEQLTRSHRAIQVMTVHIAAVVLLACLVFLYSVAVAVLADKAHAIVCSQPPCTPRDYARSVAWAAVYHIGNWLAILAFVPNRFTACLCADACMRRVESANEKFDRHEDENKSPSIEGHGKQPRPGGDQQASLTLGRDAAGPSLPTSDSADSSLRAISHFLEDDLYIRGSDYRGSGAATAGLGNLEASVEVDEAAPPSEQLRRPVVPEEKDVF